MFAKFVVALDITDTKIRAINIENNKITKWIAAPVPEGLIQDGIVHDPQAVAVIIDTLFKSQNFPRDRLVCSLTGLPFIYRSLNMPDVKGLAADAIEREARRELSVTEAEMYLFYQPTVVHEDKSEKEYFILAVPRNALDSLMETLTKAKIKPYMIDIKPLTLARAVSMKDAIVVSLDKHYFDIVIVADGLVRVIHSMSPLNQQEDPMAIVNDFIDGLSKAIKYFNRDYQKSLSMDTPVIISGELSSNPEIPRLVQEASGRQVIQFKTREETEPDFPVASFVGVLGLAEKKTARSIENQYHDINLNLLPGVRKAAARQFKVSYAIAIVIVLILAAAVYQAWVLKTDTQGEVTRLEASSTKITQQIVAAQQANKDALAAKAAATSNLAAVSTSLTNLRGDNLAVSALYLDYASRLVAINDSFPEGAGYTHIAMLGENITVDGTILSPSDILEFTNTLEKQKYFSGARIAQLNMPDSTAPDLYKFQVVITNKSEQ